MVSAKGAAAPEPWPRLRQPRFALWRNRIQPGPLKSVEGQGRRPAWAACAGLLGLSLVTTWAVASQLRTEVAVAEQPVPLAIAEPSQDVAGSVRTVGTAPAPQVAPADETPLAPEASPSWDIAGSPIAPQPALPAMAAPAVPASKPAASPSVELGALPVLMLDETAFDAVQVPVSETTLPAAARAHKRP